MTILEFQHRLNSIYQTLFANNLVENNSTATTYFDAVQPFMNVYDHPFFTFREENDDTIQFRLSSRNADLFMVKKSEMQQDDPIVSISEEQDWASYEFDLSTLLLTEYVNWVSVHANNKLTKLFTGYGIYVPVKKHWDQFFNPFSYPNKIWIGKEIKSVIYIQNETGTLTCMTNNAETLKQAQELLIEK